MSATQTPLEMLRHAALMWSDLAAARRECGAVDSLVEDAEVKAAAYAEAARTLESLA